MTFTACTYRGNASYFDKLFYIDFVRVCAISKFLPSLKQLPSISDWCVLVPRPLWEIEVIG